MKKLYEKSELWFALVWIAIYALGNSLANPLSERIGIEKSAHAVNLAVVVAYTLILLKTLPKKPAAVADAGASAFVGDAR